MYKKILRIGVLLLFISTLLAFSGCVPKAKTINERINEISEIVERRYIATGKFDGYEIFPLYNEDNEIKHFLIEFAPTGYLYVDFRDVEVKGLIGAIFEKKGNFAQYSVGNKNELEKWHRYRLCINGQEPEPFEGRKWVSITQEKYLLLNVERDWDKNYRYEYDGQTREFLLYTDSHFKVANIQSERRYLLKITGGGGYVPAVKVGTKYLNLVSMEEIIYSDKLTIYNTPYAELIFIMKGEFDLDSDFWREL